MDVAVRAPATPSPGRKPKHRARLPPHRRRSAEPAAAARLVLPPRPTDVRGLAPGPLAPALPALGQPLAAAAPSGQGWPPAQAPGAALAPAPAPAPRRSSFEELASPWAAALDAGRGVGAGAARARAAPPPGPRAAGQHEAGPQPPRSAFASAAPLSAARGARPLPPASVFASAALDSFDSSDSSDVRPISASRAAGPAPRAEAGPAVARPGAGAAPPRPAATGPARAGPAGELKARLTPPEPKKSTSMCAPARRARLLPGVEGRLAEPPSPACLPAALLCGRQACRPPAAGGGTAPGGRAHVPRALPGSCTHCALTVRSPRSEAGLGRAF